MGEAWRVHGRIQDFRQRDLVAFADAGLGEDGCGGLGWLIVDREQAILVAAGRQRAAVGEHGDINDLEARAQKLVVDMLVTIRLGYGVEAGAGCQLDLEEREEVDRLGRGARSGALVG